MDCIKQELGIIREFFEQNYDTLAMRYNEPFPYQWCRRGSAFIAYVKRWYVVEGMFFSRGEPETHVMNFDPKTGNFADITMDQFGKNFPKVYYGPQPERFEITHPYIKIGRECTAFDAAMKEYELFLDSPGCKKVYFFDPSISGLAGS